MGETTTIEAFQFQRLQHTCTIYLQNLQGHIQEARPCTLHPGSTQIQVKFFQMMTNNTKSKRLNFLSLKFLNE